MRANFQIPEIVLGVLLAVLIFGMGLLASPPRLSQPICSVSEQSAKCESRELPSSEGFLQKTMNDPIAIFTLVLVVANIGLWVVTGKTLRHSRETAQRQLRAYISHKPMGAQYDGTNLKYAEMNFGTTPAKDVTMFICVMDGTSAPDHFNGPFEKLQVMSYVAPGQEIGKLIPGHSNKSALFLYGYVDYTDIFDNKWRRRFAFNYSATRPKGGDDQWHAHHEHNDEIPQSPGDL